MGQAPNTSMEQPARDCPHRHDGLKSACGSGCSCSCMHCVGKRAEAYHARQVEKSRGQATCPFRHDVQEGGCFKNCDCECKTCFGRRHHAKIDAGEICPSGHHAPGGHTPYEECQCSCPFCSKVYARDVHCPFGCDARHTCPLECSCVCRCCLGRRHQRECEEGLACPSGHHGPGGHGVTLDKACGCRCKYCKDAWGPPPDSAAVRAERTRPCPGGCGKQLAARWQWCGPCGAARNAKCPDGHRRDDGTHVDWRACSCHCEFCVWAMRRAKAPVLALNAVPLPCPYGHADTHRTCRQGCLCQCYHCVAFTRYLRHVREACPAGHARPDGSHDCVSDSVHLCPCGCVFCKANREGAQCPFLHDALLLSPEHECSCFCTFCVKQRNGGPPAMNDTPAKIAPAKIGSPGTGYRRVTVTVATPGPTEPITNRGSLVVGPCLYQGEVCRVEKVDGNELVLLVVGDMKVSPADLPPPPPVLMMPRLTRQQVAELLCELHTFVYQTQPSDAESILALANGPPASHVNFQAHLRGNSAAAIMRILCGEPEPPPKPGQLFDVHWRTKSGARRIARLRRNHGSEAAAFVSDRRQPGDHEHSYKAAELDPIWDVSFIREDDDQMEIENVIATDADQAIRIVQGRWNGVSNFQGKRSTGHDD